MTTSCYVLIYVDKSLQTLDGFPLISIQGVFLDKERAELQQKWHPNSQPDKKQYRIVGPVPFQEGAILSKQIKK